MEITLNLADCITAVISAIVLAMFLYAFILLKSLRATIKKIQTKLQAGRRQWQKSRDHIEAAEASLAEIRTSLGLTEDHPAQSPRYRETGIAVHLAEFKGALKLFKQRNLGSGKT